MLTNTQLQIPCVHTRLESQSQPQSQTQPESPTPDSESSQAEWPYDDLETLPEAVRVFQDMFRGSTPLPDFCFGLSPEMEVGLIPKGEEGDPTKVCNTIGISVFLHPDSDTFFFRLNLSRRLRTSRILNPSCRPSPPASPSCQHNLNPPPASH